MGRATNESKARGARPDRLTSKREATRENVSGRVAAVRPEISGRTALEGHPRGAQRDATTGLHATKNDLGRDVREKSIDLLQRRLADAIDLQTQCKQAHWNVKGPSFIALHELFDEINEHVEDYIDLIAERIVQLGGVADGLARSVAKRTTLPEYPLEATSGLDHSESLSSALAAFGRQIRRDIPTADDGGDVDTADVFTEISRGVDKYTWFVEAHLQAEH